MLPTVIAALASLSASAWLGEPVQLFTVLAHFLILGTGVDYGIFLLEHHTDPSSLAGRMPWRRQYLAGIWFVGLVRNTRFTHVRIIDAAWRRFVLVLSPCFRSSADADMTLSH